ncbi:hypothetical protein ALC56_12132 [Trachymyrmex septentrionalis]|uniref:Uncharacterized protein n=1 Tax=Trachymyrmex septentrionalis TaxID=34720 RepID=A0A195EYQ0_9HYME|nr:hypothetical protein ALC56_12132 [Trachymyrmex septentrionalis]
MNRTVANTCQPISTIVFESQRTQKKFDEVTSNSLKNDIGRFHITYVEWRGISKKEVGGSGWKVEKQQESGVAGEDGKLREAESQPEDGRVGDKNLLSFDIDQRMIQTLYESPPEAARP